MRMGSSFQDPLSVPKSRPAPGLHLASIHPPLDIKSPLIIYKNQHNANPTQLFVMLYSLGSNEK